MEVAGQIIPVRRKGIALLYVLALEGPTRRERMAHMLWGHGGAANNLRVELHRLRRVLGDHGVSVTGLATDPLQPPGGMTVVRSGQGDIMEGLEDVSPDFSEWLEWQRSKHDHFGVPAAPQTGTIPPDLLTSLRPPFVLVVEVPPGATAAPAARELATHLRLPFVEGVGSGGPAVHLLSANESAELWQTVADDSTGVWVLQSNSMGDDPPLLLTLRSRLQAERMSYLALPKASWREAREGFLAEATFELAAGTFLASGGHPAFLKESASLIRQAAGNLNEIPVPQRIRAAYLLEAQALSREALLALERLSVVSGAHTLSLLDHLGVTPHLEELERLGWLTYDGNWHFADTAARTVLRSTLQPGRRHIYQDEARALEVRPEGPASAGQPIAEISRAEARIGQPYLGWTAHIFGPGAEQRGSLVTLFRSGNEVEDSGLELAIEQRPLLVHLFGSVHAPCLPTQGSNMPFRINARGSSALCLRVMDGQSGPSKPGVVDHWYYVENAGAISVRCIDSPSVVDFEVALYAASESLLARNPDLALTNGSVPPEDWLGETA